VGAEADPSPEVPWELRLRAGLREHEAQRDRDEDTLPERYEHVSVLGEGGMGQVLSAHDTELGRDVAVKRIPGGGGLEARKRLLREARALARVRHPNVVVVHELVNHRGEWHVVMDHVRGASLQEVLQQRVRLPADEATRVALALAEGLACLHAADVVHRDVKPGNVVISTSGRPVLLDLGLSKLHETSQALSKAGQVLGTPTYMAPEQIRDPQTVDGRADVYGLGATLYHMLTGSPPHVGTVEEVLTQALTIVPKSPAECRGTVDAFASEICMRCLAKDPRDRYATAADLVTELRRHQSGVRAGRRGGSRLGFVVALISVALLGGVAWALQAPRGPVGVSSADVQREARALLEAPGFLAQDREAISSLVARWRALPEAARTRARSARSRARVGALNGLLAFAEGRVDVARSELKRLARSSNAPEVRALDSALRRDAEGLTRAIARGLSRADLRAWRVSARAAEGLASRPDAEEVLADLRVLGSLRDLSPAERGLQVRAHAALGERDAAESALSRIHEPPVGLRWSVCLIRVDADLERRPADLLARLAPLPPFSGNAERRRALARTCQRRCASELRGEPRALSAEAVSRLRTYLRLGRALAPEEPLSDALTKSLLLLLAPLQFNERRLELALTLSDVAPDVLAVQRTVGLLVNYLRRPHRVRVAPALRRAIELEADVTRRLHLEMRLLWLLSDETADATAVEEGAALAARVLPRVQDPLTRSTAFMFQGRCQEALGNGREALASFDASIALYPGHAQAYSNRGLLLHALGEPERALKDLLHYLDAEDRSRIDQRPALVGIWEIGREEGWGERARPALESELLRIPSRPGWWVRLAWLQQRAGLTVAARRSLTKALETNTGGATVRFLSVRVRELLSELHSDALDSLVEDLETLRGSGTDP
jgi:tetratricopeptide (TPR) repeat protein